MLRDFTLKCVKAFHFTFCCLIDLREAFWGRNLIDRVLLTSVCWKVVNREIISHLNDGYIWMLHYMFCFYEWKKLFTILSTRWQDKVTKAALIPSCQVVKQGQEQLSLINRPFTSWWVRELLYVKMKKSGSRLNGLLKNRTSSLRTLFFFLIYCLCVCNICSYMHSLCLRKPNLQQHSSTVISI